MRTAWFTPGALAAGLAVTAAHAVGAGWRGVLLLAVFVVSSSALTRARAPRRAVQVLANGGVAAVAALLVPRWPDLGRPLLLGALAAAQADTWATELGGRSATAPRDLLTGRAVAPGTSGGVTRLGTTGGCAGAALLAAVAWSAGFPVRLAAAALVAGAAGMLLDSAIGTTAQARYICEACGGTTETRTHCGRVGRRTAGLPGLGNDVVNAVATLAGGWLCWWLVS